MGFLKVEEANSCSQTAILNWKQPSIPFELREIGGLTSESFNQKSSLKRTKFKERNLQLEICYSFISLGTLNSIREMR